MKETRAADAAFPTSIGNYHGMTLRDYFAGQALAGILANNYAGYKTYNVDLAYQHADEMMRQRGLGG